MYNWIRFAGTLGHPGLTPRRWEDWMFHDIDYVPSALLPETPLCRNVMCTPCVPDFVKRTLREKLPWRHNTICL